MSKIKLGEAIELVAAEHGFMGCALVKPGERFMFTPTKLDKKGEPRLPKWAALPGDPKLAAKKPMAGDTRPIATQRAVKAKMDGTGRAEQAITD